MKVQTDWFCQLCTGDILPCNSYDDDSIFAENLYNLFSDSTLSFDFINNMIFNPFSFNENEKISFFDVDPDLNLFLETSFVNARPSEYYTEDSFVDKFVNGAISKMK